MKYQMYINGVWKDANSGEEIEVKNPATGEVVGSVAFGSKSEAIEAVDAAQSALKSWSGKTAGERSQILMSWNQLVNEHTDELAMILTCEQGKPLPEARGEIGYANSFISWYAEEAKRVYGETIPASSPNKRILVLKQPVGVVAAITPWNFPAAMITRKIAPALAAGCTTVIKPSEETPLTAVKLVELAEEAGIPKGVINLVIGEPKPIGEAWLADQRVKKITFTGSTAVGKILMKGAADTVKKVSLELGGHAPLIVFDDADLDKAVKGAVASKFRNNGQTCVCANRIFVHKKVINEFTEKFIAKVKELKMGIGIEEGVMVGPLISKAAVDKVQKHIDDAVSNGAKVELGGKLSDQYNDGYFFEPTILSGVNKDMLIMKEETFGPVAPIIRFESEEEVLEKANNTQYGLAAYAFTENMSRTIRVAEALEYGIIGMNDGVPSATQAPFGGLKESGLGKEGGHHGIEEFLETKFVSLGIM